MARVRQYLDVDVLTAARDRVRHIYDTFDTTVVSFSGGKDSTVVMELCWEEAARRGRVLEAFYRDEEFVPASVLDIVRYYLGRRMLNLRCFAFHQKMQVHAAGIDADVISWDKGREWVRKMDSFVKLVPGVVDSRAQMDEHVLSHYRGRVAFVQGIRAEESLVRYRSVVNKLNENYINKSHNRRLMLTKPIYDWREKDVLKFIYVRKLPICDWYERQHLSGQRKLRIAGVMHGEAREQLKLLPRQAPRFWGKIVQAVPALGVQARYGMEIDRDRLLEEYSDGMGGCRRFIEEQITSEKMRTQALYLYRKFVTLNRNDPVGYPARNFLLKLVRGSIHLDNITWGWK